MSIANNVKAVTENIKEAADRTGRDLNDITLIAVTKTIGTEQIKEIISCGITTLGENRVQEFLPKYEVLSTLELPPKWHFIGHLQKNKVKYIIDKVDLIHSVDSIELAQEINKQAEKTGRIMPILAQVNIAEESSKYGMPCEQIFDFIAKTEHMSYLQLNGLMCVPPFVENAQENRPNFKKMRTLIVDIHKGSGYHKTPFNLKELSMGMSGDYAVAIEEGSTMVRIGTSLFGERV